MATFTAVNNGDGTATLQVRGAVVNCTQVRIGFGTFAYNNSAFDFLDNEAPNGSASYTCQFLNSSGTVLGTLNASVVVTWPSGSLSVTTSGPYSGCSWSNVDDNNAVTTFAGATLVYAINGGSQVRYSAVNGLGLSGSTGATAVFVGYSATVQWTIVFQWNRSGTEDAVTAASNSGTTGPPPPSPPNPPTNLVGTDNITSVDLAWTASAGGASGYEISRNGSVIATQTGTTKTDSSPGSNRPVNYSIRAYNSNASGTAYSSAISVTVGGVDSGGILIC